MESDVKNPPAVPSDTLLFVFGVLFPFLMLRIFINVFHYNDLGIFAGWAECWKTDASHVYSLCQYANYPYLGMLFTAGLISGLKDFFQQSEFAATVIYFRTVLAMFDALNFILLVALARALKIHFPVRIALMIAVLPSSWAGGAIFGQIDNISQFFLLAGLYGLMRAYQTALEPGFRPVGCFFLALLSLVAGLLTKQLAIFSIAALTPLAILVLYRFRTAPKLDRLLLAGCILAAAGFFLVLDRQMSLPGYFGSSYFYVWFGGGSHHINRITYDGFNIWTLLGRDPASASDVPFFSLSLFGRELRLTPLASGLALYGLYAAMVSQLCYRFARKRLSTLGDTQTHVVLGCAVLYLAMINLGFNVFLTGTTSRYLYHFYPFLFLAAFGLTSTNAFARAPMIGLYVATSVFYGVHVLSCIAPEFHWLAPVAQSQFLALVHGALLVVLVLLGFRPAEKEFQPCVESAAR